MSLSKVMSQDLGYNESGKKSFHREAKKLLKKVAKDLGFTTSDYDLSSNKAGIACSGEVTLRSETLYIMISQNSIGVNGQVLYRSTEGRAVSSPNGSNNHMSAEELESGNGLAKLKRVGCL